MTGTSRIARIAAVIVLAAAVPATAGSSADEDPDQGAAAFAWGLYRLLAAEGGAGNVFFSPYSIESALGMTLLGARGETAREMSATLRADEGWHERMRQRHERITGIGPVDERPFELTAANALWVQSGYPLRDAYLDQARHLYGAAPEAVDFRADVALAVRRINDWVAAETARRITDLLTIGSVPPDTRLVLTNAVYFKSAWQKQFLPGATGPAPFHRGDGSAVEVPMMQQVGRFGYRELEDAQALQLPYVGGQLAMLVLLPRTPQGLPALENALDAGRLGELAATAALPTRRVAVHLPRWRVEQTLRLGPHLAALGMATAFSAERADFSGITGGRDLFIGEVAHKAFVEVDEQGTEAAAATAVIMMPTSIAGPEEEPVVFRADRPFLFCIVHQPSRTILFLGRVVDPS